MERKMEVVHESKDKDVDKINRVNGYICDNWIYIF